MELKDLIYNALSTIKNNPSDTLFALEFTNAIETFIESAKGTTIEGGTISLGVYAGEGKLKSIKGDTETCKTTILDCCTKLKTMSNGELFLAEQLSIALYLLGFNGVFTYDSNGTVTQGSSSTPIKGESVGNLTINKVILQSSMLSLFSSFKALPKEDISMYNSRLEIGTTYKDSDYCFASKFAEILQPIIEVGIIKTKGLLNLEGSIGEGVLNFIEEKKNE